MLVATNPPETTIPIPKVESVVNNVCTLREKRLKEEIQFVIFDDKLKIFKTTSLKKESAIAWLIKYYEVSASNSRQRNLIGNSLIERYVYSLENQIMENLMKTDADKDFAPLRIAEKLSLLKKFVRNNFSNPDRYSGENKKIFEEFKLLSEDKRQQVIDNLTKKSLSIE